MYIYSINAKVIFNYNTLRIYSSNLLCIYGFTQTIFTISIIILKRILHYHSLAELFVSG